MGTLLSSGVIQARSAGLRGQSCSQGSCGGRGRPWPASPRCGMVAPLTSPSEPCGNGLHVPLPRRDDLMSAPEVVCIRRLRKTFESDGLPVRALRRVDLTVSAGEFVAIMGPSGCGKSTLLNLIAGLDTPTDGDIDLAGIQLEDA